MEEVAKEDRGKGKLAGKRARECTFAGKGGKGQCGIPLIRKQVSVIR